MRVWGGEHMLMNSRIKERKRVRGVVLDMEVQMIVPNTAGGGGGSF